MSLQVRILLTVLTLLLLPVYSVVAGAEETAIRISISPTSGPVETSIAVMGEGAHPDHPVQVMLAANGETGAGAVTVVQVDPDPDGLFVATLAVPAVTLDGLYAVRAEQRDTYGTLVRHYWASFSVGDVLIPDTGGLPGTTLTITAVLAALLVSMMVFQGARLVVKNQK